MDFVEYANAWVKSELTQARFMIGIGILLLLAFFGIMRSQHELLKGSLIPLGLLLVVLIGYGSYIMYSRPAHAKQSIALYTTSKAEAIQQEATKHINDNKAGKTLMRYVYPILMLVSVLGLILVQSPYYKGMALGFVLLALAAYIMDYGFVSRSDAFLAFLETIG